MIKILSVILFLSLTSCKTKLSGILGGSSNEAPKIVSIDDGGFTNSVSQSPTISWDTEESSESSADVTYRYAIGTSPGDDDTVEWTDAGTSTTLNLSSLTLISGQTYYISIVVVSADGTESDPVNSDGFMVDTDNPTATSAPVDGTAGDTSSSPVVTWSSASDSTSSISYYEASIGTTAGAADVVTWTNIGDVTNHQFTGLSLTPGSTYYFSVRAVDEAGNTGLASDSDGWLVDTDNPTAAGVPGDGTYNSDSSKSPTATWTAASDTSSAVDYYEASVGLTAGAADVVTWTNVGNVLSHQFTGLTLSSGTNYYFSVRAVDQAGNTGPATDSDGWLQDHDNPSAPGAIDDGDYRRFNTKTRNVSWTVSTDSTTSIDYYEAAVGTSTGSDNVVSWTNIGNVTSHMFTGLSLTNGSTYYFSVRAVDVAGNTGAASEGDGWVVDTDNPTSPGSLSDDGDYFEDLTKSPAMTWSASSDSTTSIAYYEASIGLSAGAADVVGWTNVGNVVAHQFTGQSLTGGTTYYYSVRSVDLAGNDSAEVHSNGWIAGNYCSNKSGWLTYNASGNAGTPADPYEICNAAQLANIGTTGAALSASYILMQDIDLAPYYAAPNSEFQIGACTAGGCASWNGASVYSGTFDGNNKMISNFSFINASQNGSAFIASFGSDGVLKNLTMDTAVVSGYDYVSLVVGGALWGEIENVHATGTMTVAGGSSGGIVGDTFSVKISNCSADVTITGPTQGNVGGIAGKLSHSNAINCESSGSINSSWFNVGGFVGSIEAGQISSSRSSMNVTATNSSVGGFAGYVAQNSRISNSYATGTATGVTNVGGFAGQIRYDSMVTRSYATGNATATSGGDAGGFVGQLDSNSTVSSSYATGDVLGAGSVNSSGRFVGNNSATITDVYFDSTSSCDSTGSSGACNTDGTGHSAESDFHNTSNMPISSWDREGSSVNGDSDHWAFTGSAHPTLWFEDGYGDAVPFTGDGDSASPYTIGSVADWNLISQNPRWMHKHFELSGNINFTASSFNQVGGFHSPFSGSFDGKNFTLSNITHNVPSEDFVGIFGMIVARSAVKNFTVTNAAITGDNFVGGFVGHLDSTSLDSIIITSGTISGAGEPVGGIVAIAEKSNIDNSSNGANVSGFQMVGGIIGDGSNTNITSCSSSGTVSGTHMIGGILGHGGLGLNRVYSHGNITATGDHAGGIIGYSTGGSISDGYAIGDITADKGAGGAIGTAINSGTYTNVFATGDVNGQDGTTEVGYFYGNDAGSSTFTNIHYWSGASCDSTGSGGACSTNGTAVATESDFYSSSNAPLSSWVFPWEWVTTGTYPKLDWQ